MAPETPDSSIFAGASSDIQEKGAEMQVRNTVGPPPVGWGSFLRGTKNDQEIFPEAFWEIPKFFFGPGGAQERSGADLC